MNGLYILTDLLTIESHSPNPEPVKYDKTDGHWYTHDGVDVEETQQRRGTVVEVNVKILSSFCNIKCFSGIQ